MGGTVAQGGLFMEPEGQGGLEQWSEVLADLNHEHLMPTEEP